MISSRTLTVCLPVHFVKQKYVWEQLVKILALNEVLAVVHVQPVWNWLQLEMNRHIDNSDVIKISYSLTYNIFMFIYYINYTLF